MDAVTRDLAIHVAAQLAATDRSADRFPSLAEYHRGEVAAYRDTLSWLAGYAGLGSIDKLLSQLDELAAAARRPAIEQYGTAEHEAWLVERERDEP